MQGTFSFDKLPLCSTVWKVCAFRRQNMVNESLCHFMCLSIPGATFLLKQKKYHGMYNANENAHTGEFIEQQVL